MPKPTDTAKWNYMFSDDIKFVQKVIIFHPDQAENFLTLQRSSDSASNSDKWDFAGGNVLYGQNAMDSLASEIIEETGISDYSEPLPIHILGNMLDDRGIYQIYIGYCCTAITSEVKISHEHQDYRWVDIEEFLELDANPLLKETVSKLSQYKKLS